MKRRRKRRLFIIKFALLSSSPCSSPSDVTEWKTRVLTLYSYLHLYSTEPGPCIKKLIVVRLQVYTETVALRAVAPESRSVLGRVQRISIYTILL